MGIILSKTAYEWPFTVSSFEVDCFDRLKLSALMKRQQEIGELHLTEFGTDSDKLRDGQGIAFIFTKINIKINRLPKSKNRVVLTTWCSGLKGVRFTRNYVLKDISGEILTETKAEVTAIDLNTRKIVRPKSIIGFENFLYNDTLENGCESPEKIELPNEFDSVFERAVRFSDIDFNGHVNNTVYADMIFDCLDCETLKSAPTELAISFLNEAVLGEVLKIEIAKTESGFCYQGLAEDSRKFTAKIKY